ncbi:MAG TPA: ATP-binding cassette domain-containing protein, partial [Burkholderiales bacterium]
MLQVDKLHVEFQAQGKPVHAVRGISFEVKEGETVALVGESGSGKSVTALSILQLLPYPRARHPEGSIRFRGTELIGAGERVLSGIRGDRIAMIFQEPMTSLNPLHTIAKQIGETLRLHKGMAGAQARSRTLELLRLVGLPEPEKRLAAYPHQLSGGQRQRVMIAMALANEPDLLIADEPTTALDVTIQAQILALLKDLQQRFGMALLLITHDLAIVRKMAQRICVMTEGEIVEQSGAQDIFERPQHAYTKKLLAAQPGPRPPRSSEGTSEVARADELKVWFPIKAGVLRRTVGVVGESGSGKTTLGLALLRLQQSEGGVYFDGRSVQGLSWGEL